MTTPALALLCMFFTASLQAAESAADVKAAFIFNFARFVEWPATAFAAPAAPFNLCVMRADALGGRLQALAGREAQGHRIDVIDLATSTRAPRDCHLLFVDEDPGRAWQPLRDTLVNAPVLTIGEGAAFVDQGGMISLRVERGRLRFDVDLDAVQTGELRMGARILQLANDVRRGR